MGTQSDSTQTERLLTLAAAGDPAAINQLIDDHRSYLRRLIDLRMEQELRARVDPSDVVQQTQMVASQRLDDYLQRRPTSFRLWLRRKALEQLVDLRRRHVHAAKRSVRSEQSISHLSSMAIARGLLAGPPSERLRKKEQADLVRRAVESLREADREVILMRHAEELTNAEVAEVLGINTATASQRYGRAVRQLREQLTKLGVSHEA